MKENKTDEFPWQIRYYLARMGYNRDHIVMDEGAWRYPVDSFLEGSSQELLDRYEELLPQVVPGLCVARAGFLDSRVVGRRGYLWFSWTLDGMWRRIREVFEEYGVSDERLAYSLCSGVLNKIQLRLPGMVEPESRSKRIAGVFASWTQYGLQNMDSGFCQRIREPDRGGPGTTPYASQRCVVGDDWWLVGTRGDSMEVMSLEILGSPLDARTKENLLTNLNQFRKLEGVEERKNHSL